MSVVLLSLTLGLASAPPPPPELELDSLENDEKSEAGPPPPPVTDSETTPESELEGSQEPSADPDEGLSEAPAGAGSTDATIRYDEHGEPLVPYGEAQTETGDMPFDENPVPEEELPFGDADGSQSGEDLPLAGRPPRGTPSRAALERQATIDVDEGPPGGGASPQRFALEFKFGPYRPSVDESIESAGLGPYATIFGETNDNGVAVGDAELGLFSAVSFEWQFLNFGGPLSIGTQIGFFRDKADGILAETQDGSIRSRADQVSFTVVPVAALLGYRFELLADRWRVPFVPYVRGGFAYGFWWSKDGSGDVSTNDADEKGRGGSLGWQANMGMMLQMDFIERGSAGALDRNTGINHTYLFGEYQVSKLNGFGSGNRMSVGDATYMVGLAVEF